MNTMLTSLDEHTRWILIHACTLLVRDQGITRNKNEDKSYEYFYFYFLLEKVQK